MLVVVAFLFVPLLYLKYVGFIAAVSVVSDFLAGGPSSADADGFERLRDIVARSRLRCEG